ncbi:Mitochondrial acidic protein mam33 [Tilletia horrida]|uniref:Mitochondrial acidic protein mam33 n=1 Tax=Tilletia horrida TaxID=155126 RepID=A0AAN6GNH0_9BASI|nr:Mitochondrial acidic protein mam33 [Tilletia horrida]KAK0549858.1 Mitochondrial acidic protein mam33 [Tilletia horrida]KAK0562373.1 Mitochondrial acidic protein mam33 [Tilletia horrida]
MIAATRACLNLRSVASAATRSARPLANASAAVAPTAQRIQSSVSRLHLQQPTASSSSRLFSASALRASHGESDAELANRLAEEIKYEQEAAAEDDAAAASAAPGSKPEFVESFLSTAPHWTILDNPNSDEVIFTREFGNESIRVLYSIGDIDTHAAQNALDDAAEDRNSGIAPESADGDAEDGAQASHGRGNPSDFDDEYANIPIRAAITISKPNAGAMTLEALVQDGAWVIENISYYSDAKLATDPTAEADWARRGLYIGPQFDTLDVKVQEQFEFFLEERGFDAPLAIFLVQYAEYKEQNEYRTWLERVKKFVEA